MIFPFIDALPETQDSMPREYAWDFSRGDFLLRAGRPYIVEGLEAVKVMIYKIIKTERYKWAAYTWDYGIELEALIGQRMQQADAVNRLKAAINDAIQSVPYVRGVISLEANYEGQSWHITAIIDTSFGEVDISV